MPNLPIPKATARRSHRNTGIECSLSVLKSGKPDSLPRRMALILFVAAPFVVGGIFLGVPAVCLAIQQGGLAMRGLL